MRLNLLESLAAAAFLSWGFAAHARQTATATATTDYGFVALITANNGGTGYLWAALGWHHRRRLGPYRACPASFMAASVREWT